MALKRRSLAEIRDEELVTSVTTDKEIKTTDKETKAANRKAKADFVRMSITVEPELFDEIQQISNARRRKKLEFTFSSIIRDSLKDYIRVNGLI